MTFVRNSDELEEIYATLAEEAQKSKEAFLGACALDQVRENLKSLDVEAKKIEEIVRRLRLPQEDSALLYPSGRIIDILDPSSTTGQEKVIGQIDKNIAEAAGLWHRTANVALVTPDFGLILQQRAGFKKYPHLWTILGGHLEAGFSYLDSVVNEVTKQMHIYDQEELTDTFKERLKQRLIPVGFPGDSHRNKPLL